MRKLITHTSSKTLIQDVVLTVERQRVTGQENRRLERLLLFSELTELKRASICPRQCAPNEEQADHGSHSSGCTLGPETTVRMRVFTRPRSTASDKSVYCVVYVVNTTARSVEALRVYRGRRAAHHQCELGVILRHSTRTANVCSAHDTAANGLVAPVAAIVTAMRARGCLSRSARLASRRLSST